LSRLRFPSCCSLEPDFSSKLSATFELATWDLIPPTLLLFRIDPTLNNYDGARFNRTVEQVIERLQSIDGVRGATVTNNALIGGGGNTRGGAGKDGLSVTASFMATGSNFFAEMGIPIILGRNFGPQDHANAPSVVVIEELNRCCSGWNRMTR